MNIIITILLVLAGIIALVLLLGLLMKKEHYVRRSIVVNAPRKKVFDFLRMIKNQEKFNQWAKTDPGRKEEFLGTDGTVGYIYSWSGNNKAGEGQKQIKNIIEGQKIETEIRFVKPMAVTAAMIMETESLTVDQTKVYFTNTGTLKYPLNVMIPVFEKNFGKALDTSLSTLKNILENDHSTS